VTNPPDDVKPRRPYHSQRRREQALETRERVLDAAARLFTERGFESATVAGIAEEAGVAPETIYAAFGNKRTLLGELVRQAVRGPDEAPVLEQAGPVAVAALGDQREQLQRFAEDVALRLERVGPLLEVLATAARSDPGLAELLAKVHAERLANLRALVDALAANGPLRIDAEAALDNVWALASPELHRLLARTRGWDRTRYCAWLADALGTLLL
jgi:AcrR family transcriptional regulator